MANASETFRRAWSRVNTDAASRRRCIESLDVQDLRTVLALPNLQKAVRTAAERRMKALTRLETLHLQPIPGGWRVLDANHIIAAEVRGTAGEDFARLLAAAPALKRAVRAAVAYFEGEVRDHCADAQEGAHNSLDDIRPQIDLLADLLTALPKCEREKLRCVSDETPV